MFQKKLFNLIIFSFLTTQVFALADLVVTSATFSSSYGLKSFKRGEPIFVDISIKNSGNVTAPANFCAIILSSDLTIDNGDLSILVTLPELAANKSTTFRSFFFVPNSSDFVGDYHILVSPDIYQQITETEEQNYYANEVNSTNSVFTIKNEIEVDRQTPCPIIFIHGLNSSEQTWYPYEVYMMKNFGWKYGGKFNFCLNKDKNQYTTNNKDWIDFTSNKDNGTGDFYNINFDVNDKEEIYVSESKFGYNDDRSNQSAIVKQGWAVSKAIKYVLESTGANEVILVGHSMGGLASREYIQNSSNWQVDGKHHVAKLITVDSPNGGSNRTLSILDYLGQIDNSSDAVRDLRYKDFPFKGKYLFGGNEGEFTTFYNDDINSDGDTNDKIIGLNEKKISNSIATSCIISSYKFFPVFTGQSDQIVDTSSQNLNNYLTAEIPFTLPVSEIFRTTSSHMKVHTTEANFDEIAQALDESSFYTQAFDIKDNFVYLGYITEQAENNPVPAPYTKYDLDDYKIILPSKGKIKLFIWNISVPDFKVLIVDKNYKTLHTINGNGINNYAFETANLDAGEYYIEVQALPDKSSWYSPYAFGYIFTPDTGLFANFSTTNTQGCAPYSVTYKSTSQGTVSNFQWSFPGGTPSTSTSSNPTIVYNTPGNYSAALTIKNTSNQNTYEKKGLVNIKGAAFASFTTNNLDSNKIQFNNKSTTNFSGSNISYLWEFGDNAISIQENIVHKYANSKSYTAKLTVKNACGSSSVLKDLKPTTPSTDGFSINSSLKIIPNPNNGNFRFQLLTVETGNLEIEIFEASGRSIYKNTIVKTSEELIENIDLNSLSKGTYFVKAKIQEAVFQETIIIN